MPFVYNDDIAEYVEYDISDPEQKKLYMRYYHRMYRKDNVETLTDYRKQYNKKIKANPEMKAKRDASVKKYRENLSEEKKEALRINMAEKAKVKYHTNPEYREVHKKRCLLNYKRPEVKERMRIQYNKWRVNNPERYEAIQRRAREKKKKNHLNI